MSGRKKQRTLLFKGFLQCPVSLLLLISSLSNNVSAEPVLTLVTGDMAVGFYHSQEQTGLVDEMLEMALQRIGYRLDVLTVPAARSLKMAEGGIADGELMRTRAIEASFPNLLRVPEPLIDAEFVVFSREPIDLKKGWETLSGRSVGLVIGMKIVEESLPEGAVVTRVKSEEQLFALLEKKRIDYAAFPREIGRYHLRKNNIQGIVISEMSLDRVPAYVYLHPKHAALVPRLENALKEMKQDGAFQRLVDRHLQHRAGNDNASESVYRPQ